jgi:hypothetical protein
MKIFRIITTLFILTSVIQEASGTAQITDYLIYKGDTLAIYANPLESYFDSISRPDSIFDEYGYNSTACWRGYIGYWELTNDSLFLIELHGDSNQFDLSLIFKDRKTDCKIFADWYNYSIINPYGKLIHYEHMGYGSIYEFEREFTFSNGILNQIKEYDNSKSKKSVYTQDNKLLVNFLRINTDHSLLPDSVEKAKVFVQIYKVDNEGKIDSISVVRGYNETLDQEAMRVVKSIPEWDILYNHGERYNQTWTLPIVFEKKK